jgi:hypothetical protein
MTSSHHFHLHAPHMPASMALLGMVFGVVFGPTLLIWLMFVISHALLGVNALP